MNSQKFHEIFNRALDVSTGERAVFLKRECGDDDALFQKIQSLLNADSEAGENLFLETPAFALEAENLFEEFADSRIGQIVGDYKIVERIGEGGMGAVYLATRADGQFEKRAAVKLVKRGMDTDAILRRFLRERQILANLEHPNIARLLDAGMTEDDLPYFVMELVEGVPIDEFCRENDLELNEKLELFRKVCLAIAHAHRNLIVHRDLKPSNILVAKDGTPKLLDFGIAKLLTETDADKTKTELRVLTPAFAAPEQIKGEAITTATDVYALGLILKEIVQSLKFKVQSPNTGKIADREIQNIVSTATHEEPLRRYGSAEKFADDISNYLNGLPISARRDSFFYRAEKFVKRNRVATVAATLVFLALTFGIGIALYQAQIAEAERARAEQRFEETRGIAKAVIFNYYDEINKLQGATKVRSMMITDALAYLDKLSLDEAATHDPNLRLEIAEGYLRLGDVQGQPYGENLGDSDGAFASYKKAENLFADVPGDTNDLPTLKTLANVYQKMSLMLIRLENTREGAVEYAQKALEINEKIARLAPEIENKTVLANSYLNLAQQTGTVGKLEESVVILEKGADLTAEYLETAPENKDLLSLEGKISGRLGFHFSMLALSKQLTWDEAKMREYYKKSVPYFDRALASAKTLLQNEPENKIAQRSVTVNKSNRAEVIASLGLTDEALKAQTEILVEAEKKFAADPANLEIKFEIAEDHLDLARTFLYRGEKAAAEKHFGDGMKIMDELIKNDPTNTEFPSFQFAVFTQYYGDAQIETGDYEAALKTYQRTAGKTENYETDSEELNRGRNLLVKMRFGDIYFFKSNKENVTAKKENRRKACNFYRESLGFLDSSNTYYERLSDYINEKLRLCEAKL